MLTFLKSFLIDAQYLLNTKAHRSTLPSEFVSTLPNFHTCFKEITHVESYKTYYMIFNLKYKLPDKVGSLDLVVESCLDLTEESQISSNSAARTRTFSTCYS